MSSQPKASASSTSSAGKRRKVLDSGMSPIGMSGGPPLSDKYGHNAQYPPPYQQPYLPTHHGGLPPQRYYPPQPHQQQMHGWQQGQQPPPYGSQPPPPQLWQGGQTPQPPSSQKGLRHPGQSSNSLGGSPERVGGGSGSWGGYRGPPPQAAARTPLRQGTMPSAESSSNQSPPPVAGVGPGPPGQYQQWHHHPQPWQHSGGQPPQQYGHPPSHGGWQQNAGHSQATGASPHLGQTPLAPGQKTWNNGGPQNGVSPPRTSPTRQGGTPIQAGPPTRSSPMPGNHLCKSIGEDPDDFLMGHDIKGGFRGEASDNSSRDKGRGSYRCGKCGVPKKGHVCPYQPKLKRRPDEPLPEMRSMSTQVEMDEFLVLRRLNLEMQGYPESYASEPTMGDDMIGYETHPTQITNSAMHRGLIGHGVGSSPPLGSVGVGTGGMPPPMSNHVPMGGSGGTGTPAQSLHRGSMSSTGKDSLPQKGSCDSRTSPSYDINETAQVR